MTAVRSVTGEDGRVVWESPGLIDAHAHIGWVDFDADDRARRTLDETSRLIELQCQRMLDCGFTAMRDAGGMRDPWRYPGMRGIGGVESGEVGATDAGADVGNRNGTAGRRRNRLTVAGCAAMIGQGQTRDQSILRALDSENPEPDAATHQTASHEPHRMRTPASPWVKLFLTGGMGAPPERTLEPLMTRADIHRIIACIHAGGRKAMAHVWGGPALDWAIEAGVDTVEHGVYLTGVQAERLAAARIPLIPTVNIYRLLADAPNELAIPSIVASRAALAAEAHPRAVRLAHEAGVTLGVGTDYCTPVMFGHNLEELDALESCGLSREETWRAATETNAHIIGLPPRAAGRITFDVNPLCVAHAAELGSHLVGIHGVS